MAGLEGMPLLHGVIKALPMCLVTCIAGRVYKSFSIGLTNLGSFDPQKLALGGREPDCACFGGPLKRKPGMQVSASSLRGDVFLCIVGEYSSEDAVLLQKLLDGMEREIIRYATE